LVIGKQVFVPGNVPARQKAFYHLLFTNYYVFAAPTCFVCSVARAVLGGGLISLEEKMADAGAPGGLPLISRFSPDLFGQASPASRQGTLILVTPTRVGAMRCLFLLKFSVSPPY
jgi:hypothetical protein